MRKKMGLLVLIGAFLFANSVLWAETVTTTAQSDIVTTSVEPVDYPEYMVGDKLARGLVNILTSVLEIPRNIQNVTNEEGIFVGWTAGLGKGIGLMALRTLVGIYDTLTFPIPFPEDYRPVFEPEFVWQAPGPPLTPQNE